MADFILDATIPFCNDQQKSRLRNGVRLHEISIAASAEDLFVWKCLNQHDNILCHDKPKEPELAADRHRDELRWVAPAVASRTLATLSSKKRCRTECVNISCSRSLAATSTRSGLPQPAWLQSFKVDAGRPVFVSTIVDQSNADARYAMISQLVA